MSFVKAIEIIADAKDQQEAEEMAQGARLLDGVWGVRVIGDGIAKPWKVQAFTDLPVDLDATALPDGMQVRLVRK